MKKLPVLLLATSYLLLATKVALADGGEVVCTPVYGMANTCAEHAVVDTGLETSTFLNASALSYILGLAAFIRAKRI
jgi:hypothetical protein